jgi:hypothetical protein
VYYFIRDVPEEKEGGQWRDYKLVSLHGNVCEAFFQDPEGLKNWSNVQPLSPSNSKFEKSGGISGGQRVKWLKHKIKKVLPAIKDKIGSKSA